ncbi:YegP family protein [Chitinophaga vietnamensis]|uniref:YegP family protein n=1 Tax=Chitinophaga vietnamensis TaxID=2593957 RepID=UPI001178C330|nr:YegP family protein [Chitinophaga vietnamensis]
MGKFVIKIAKDGQHYFNLKAENGQTILSSEMYTTKSACNNGIDSVKKNAPNDNHYEKLVAKNGQHYFNLKAANGQVIGTSEMYEATSGRDNGIESVKKNAPTATVVEE